MTENEFLLQDRLGVIRDTINKYGEENWYISFSGGKDSTVIHHLVDMALPDNKIPRVFSNTGIEYQAIVEFVKEIADDRFVIIPPSKNIRETLEKVGYPFKSKMYSNWLKEYQKHADRIDPYIKMVEEDATLLDSYDFIHNLPVNVKFVISQIYGRREREGELYRYDGAPKKLMYQFNQDFKLKVSDLCCVEFKEKPLKDWQKKNKKKCKILGLMQEEGGRRDRAKCIVYRGAKITFSPLVKVSKEWEDWFIQEYNIKLCKLYYPPYNFSRTGCKGCPFNIHIQRELDTMSHCGMEAERRQCEAIWKPVYDEYRRIGYRLRDEDQMRLF